MMMQTATSASYHASWSGYDPPIQPHRPIDYERAESSAAFTIFIFDEQGRAIVFEKWLAAATACDPLTVRDRHLPVGKLFFAPAPVDESRPGRLISLGDTREMTTYFRAHVHPDGGIATLEHVHRERMIRHDYRYWENGQLREWRFDSGGEQGVEEFARDGQRVSFVSERTDG